MAYVTTKEIAERWNISTRRVTILATQGRITGAVFVGNCWMIPDDSPKPKDHRTKIGKKQKKKDDYFFPLIHFGNYLDKEAERLLPSPYFILYEIDAIFESGDFAYAKSLSEKTYKTTKNKYLKIGTSLFLLRSNVFLGKFKEAAEWLDNLKKMLSKVDNHQNELSVLEQEIKTEFDYLSCFFDPIRVDSVCSLSENCRGFLGVLKVFENRINVMNHQSNGYSIVDELFCNATEALGHYYDSMMIQISFALIDLMNKRKQRALEHWKTAVALAMKTQSYTSLAFFANHMPPSFINVIFSFNKVNRKRFSKVSSELQKQYCAFLLYLTNQEWSTQLENSEGFECRKLENMFQKFYEKTGLSGREELVSFCRNLVKKRIQQ